MRGLWGEWARRIFRCACGLAIALVIVGPFLPAPIGVAVVGKMRQVSVLQSWNMYAPDPQRAQSYLSLRAELADGTMVPLVEAEQTEHGWGSVLDWQKRREDIWRIIVAGEKQQNHRAWYLRGVCVREDRARGEPPLRIIAERVRRRLTSPAAVLAGKPALGKESREEIQTMRCDEWQARRMLTADRARRGLPPPPLPPRRGGAR